MEYHHPITIEAAARGNLAVDDPEEMIERHRARELRLQAESHPCAGRFLERSQKK